LVLSIGIIPAISPITFTSSLPVGITILAFCCKDVSKASSFRNSWAFPMKYLLAASFTSFMASASPSALNIFDLDITQFRKRVLGIAWVIICTYICTQFCTL
jgi:hypothetical protein